MSTQPEALRLAHIYESGGIYDKAAAAELRRLHEVNAELVEALRFAYANGWIKESVDKVEAAIAKTIGENNGKA